MPDGEPGRRSVWDRLAPSYGLAGPDHFSEFARRLVRLVPLDPDAAVLDLACGAGALASAVAAVDPAVNLVAVDLSADMLRRAALNIPRHGVRCAVAVMDAQRLAFADRAFATVVCGSALDSFPDPARAMAEVHRVLRQGGRLGLWVAPSWWWQGDARWTWHGDLLASLGADVGRVAPGLDGPSSLRRMIRAPGFADVRVRVAETSLWFPDARVWWQWAWSHGFRQVLEQLDPDQLAFYRRTAFERIRHGIGGRMEALLATAVRQDPDKSSMTSCRETKAGPVISRL